MSVRILLPCLAVLAACSPQSEQPATLDRVVQWSDGERTSGQSLSIDASGQIYTATFGRPDDRFRSAVRLHSPGGEAIWTAYQDPELDSMARGVKALPDGSVLLATQAKLNPRSNQQDVWVGSYRAGRPVGEQRMRLNYWDGPAEYSVPDDMDASDSGAVAVVGHGLKEDEVVMLHRSGGTVPAFSIRLAEGFEEQRGGFVALSGEHTAVGFNSGSHALGDNNEGDFDAWVALVDSTGAYVWTDHIGGLGRQGVYGGDTDSAGNVYVCGGLENLGEGRSDTEIFVRRYDADGSIAWTQQLGTDQNDGCYDLHVQSLDQLIIAGHQGAGEGLESVGVVASLNAHTGELQWHTTLVPQSAGSTFLYGVETHQDDVFVVGQTAGSFTEAPPNGTTQAILARLTSDGTLVTGH